MLRSTIALQLAAAGMAASPIASAAAAPLPGRVAAPVTDARYQDNDKGAAVSTALILATIVLLLIGVAAISGDDDPASP